MPSITAYTQYETLAFCQSVAYHGSDTTAFEDISTSLNDNQLIRESEAYDQTRLTAAALEALYHDLLAQEKHAQDAPIVNGDNGSTNGTNPRKRKLSSSPAPSDDEQPDDQKLLQSLVDRLYARFREQTLKEIRQEEDNYLRLQAEIAQIEREDAEEQERQSEAGKLDGEAQPPVQAPEPTVEAATKVPVLQPGPGSTVVPVPPGVDAGRIEQIATPPAGDVVVPAPLARSGLPQPLAPSHPPQSPSPALLPGRASAEPAQPRGLHPSAPPPQQSPGAFHRSLPVPSPQRPNYGPINPQHYQPGPQGQPLPVLSQYGGSPHMPPPAEYPPQKRGSSSSGQGRGSPVPSHIQQLQQPYPGYTGYPQQPPWPHHPPPQQQYPQPSQFINHPYYMQSPAGRPPVQYQTPHHPPYAQYPQSAPIHYQSQPPPPQAWPQPQPGQPYYSYHGSANVTPVPRSESRQAVSRGRSSTPWKRRVQPSSGVRPVSPSRPDREVSPISDTESPTRTMRAKKSPGKAAQRTDDGSATLRDAAPGARGRQQASATPSAFSGSRSQSIASFASDTPADKRRRREASLKIKAEPPSTPAAIPSDTEQQSQRATARRGRARTGTLASKAESGAPGASTSTNKRKRSLGRESASPPRSVALQVPSPVATATPRLQQNPLQRQSSLSFSNDPSLVVVTKNWTKTANLLLNDIVSHKLASIFAKPLSERDAPGYKDLVLRPQDLKSIKAAISKGGKAGLAAIEAFEERSGPENAGEREGQDDKTPTRAAPGNSKALDPLTGEKALGGGVYLLKATDDLLPPKGIVNSAQLEMELVRMFANAVMFNPLPSLERGFGRSLRLRKRGGDVVHLHKDEELDQRAESSESDDSGFSDVGGIISDTREMFEDVMAMLRKWREVELERLGNVGEADLAVSTPMPGPSKPATQGSVSGNGSVNASANPSTRHSESVEHEDDAGGASTPAASTTGTTRKRRRLADA